GVPVARSTTRASTSPPVEPEIPLPDPDPDELKALTESCDLDVRERRRILAMARLVNAREPWALLGVVQGADVKRLKRAYFKLSKEIHPDRYYGRKLGSFTERLAFVFEAVARAYDRLTNPDKADKDESVAEAAQSPQEFAAELYDRACAVEVGGDALEAM